MQGLEIMAILQHQGNTEKTSDKKKYKALENKGKGRISKMESSVRRLKADA